MTSTDPPPPRTPYLCVSCRVHLGWWPESDPRCPQCRYSGRMPEDGEQE